MSYATRTDLETRFGVEEIRQLTDRYEAGVTGEDVVAAALADADTEIDGYLAAAYTLPLASVPPLVTRLACDIARYRLWRDLAGERVRVGYEDAVDLLRRVASESVRLIVDGNEAATTGSVVTAGRTLAFGATFETAYLGPGGL